PVFPAALACGVPPASIRWDTPPAPRVQPPSAPFPPPAVLHKSPGVRKRIYWWRARAVLPWWALPVGRTRPVPLPGEGSDAYTSYSVHRPAAAAHPEPARLPMSGSIPLISATISSLFFAGLLLALVRGIQVPLARHLGTTTARIDRLQTAFALTLVPM